MLTQNELSRLGRALRGPHVLRVYVDARVTDPAERPAWRGRLATRRLALKGSRTRIQARAAAQALSLAWQVVAGRC